MIEALVFDAYGTLFDVHSLHGLAERLCPGRGDLITQVWRLKQLEYTWLREAMGAWADFETVTRESLGYALRCAGVAEDASTIDALVGDYEHLQPYPEAVGALAALAGTTRAVLSNGSQPMLDALIANARFGGLLERVVSVAPARAYKPSPRCYALVRDAIDVAPEHTLFVSSNGFDVAGAKRFGFRVAWIRRGGGPGVTPPDAGPSAMFKALRGHHEVVGPAADHVLGGLDELPDLLATLR